MPSQPPPPGLDPAGAPSPPPQPPAAPARPAPAAGVGAGLSRRDLEVLIDHNPDLVVRFDRSLRHLAVNRAVRDATGLEPEAFIGRTNAELGMPAHVVRRWDALLLGVFESGEPAEAEFRYAGPAGVRCYHSRVVPVLGPDGSVESVVAISRDVTEARRAAEALRESEERFRQLTDHIREVLWMYDADTGALLYVSPDYERVWGRSRESLRRAPDSWLDAVHPADRAVVDAFLAGLRSTPLPEGREATFRVVRPDGTVRWVCDRAFQVRDADGRVYRIAGFAEDVTEAREAAEAIRRSEERWRALTENTTDLTSILDAGAVIRYVSPSCRRILGYAPEELVGVSALDLMHPDDVPRVAATLGRIAPVPGASDTAEFRLRHADGSWRHFEGTGVSLLHHPAVRGIVTNSRDQTGKKRAEAELRERDEQLRQAQKMEAVGRLAGGIAHDFNNLLTAIKGHAQLLMSEFASGDAREDLDEIDRAADRAAALTRQLLAFSRRQVLQPQVVGLNDVVAGLQRMLRRVIGEDVELEVRLAPGLPAVLVDPGQMEQVVINLAVNARDAMPRGGRLTVETLAVDEGAAGAPELPEAPRGWVCLCVTDTGEGIDPEVLPHVFEPFFTTKEKGEGTGLGLSTVYGIVRQSGGRVDLESLPGRGTVFRIYLPATGDEPGAPAPRHAPAPHPRARGTVLLVEDDAGVRLFARRVLERAGLAVLEAHGGREAIDIARRHAARIDVLLTDVVMPAMDGRELAAEVRRLHPEARVLYMSGYTDDVIATRGVLEPGTPFLEKPFTMEALATRVRELLEAA